MDFMGLEKMVWIKEDIGVVDVVFVFCCKFILNLCVWGMVKFWQVIFFVIKINISDLNGEGNVCNNEYVGNIFFDFDYI